MSASSGIRVNASLKQIFEESGDEDSPVLYIKVQISEDDTELEVVDRGDMTGDLRTDWESVQATLEARQPCYILFRRNGEKNWIVIAWVPPHSHPRKKMLYASSREPLKRGLGSDKFDADYFIGAKDECSYDSYIGNDEPVAENSDLHTWRETERLQANIETAPTKVKAAVMHTLAIPVTDAANSGFQSLANGSTNFLLLRLDEDSEALEAVESQNIAIEQIEGFLDKEPRFVVFRYDHAHEGDNVSKVLYIYFCPESAKPKLKMFYSACVANVNELCEQFSIEVDRKLEISLPKEGSKANIEFELYPPKAEVKRFSKPSRPGRGRARLHGRKKK